jgi:iron complex outermembrane receptor protein
MNFSYTPARLAVLALLCLNAPAVRAQTPPGVLNETVITAARIPQDPSLLPQGVQVITAQQIREAGFTAAREAVRWLGGVLSRSDTSGQRESALDLRGFGETASSNTVILIDGVRQNEGDMNATVLSWLPVDSIERIEIVRGSGAVLHGEGATAGVINIITAKGLSEPGGSASLMAGSFGTTEARATARAGSGSLRYELSAAAFDSDNHRDSFKVRQRNAMARATWVDGASSLSLQLGGQHARGQLPGGLTPDEFAARPGASFKARDRASSELSNLLLSGETLWGDWRVAADLNHRRAQTVSDERSAPAVYVYQADTDTVSTRAGLRAWRSHGEATRHTLLLGMDLENWKQNAVADGYYVDFGGSQVSSAGVTHIEQRSRALYARHETNFKAQGLRVFGGVRQSWAEREASGTDKAGSIDPRNLAWELGAALRVATHSELFGRAGASFRLPNANEYTCFGLSYCATTRDLLKPQTSQDFELGYRRSMQASRWSLSYYHHRLTNEIGYFNYANRNFEPTRREGVEAQWSARLSPALEGGLQYAWRRAQFRAGALAGKDIPLAPAQTVTARVSWRMSPVQTWVLTSQWVSEQRVGDDFDNTSSERVPSYAVVNLRYSHRLDARWTLSLLASNLADKSYYNYRTYASRTVRSVYPEAGRAFQLSAQRTF